MIKSYPASTFGHIYHKALEVQLQKMGNMLSLMRKARREDIETVATAINIRPEVLEKIENGEQDFRVRTLFALCDYYNIDEKSIIGKGELLHFNFSR